MEQGENKNNLVVKGIAIIAVIAAGVYGLAKINNKKGDVALGGAQQNPITAKDSAKKVAAAPQYKDGAYTAMGTYSSPAGQEEIGISLTIKDDTIVEVTSAPQAVVPISKKFQGMFTENFKQFVVGKNINEVTLDKISGSSLTPKGFNDALNQIKGQAKA